MTGAALYAAVVAILAGTGDLGATWLVLLAAVLCLPVGFVALVGLYLSYGVIAVLANVFGAQTQFLPTWFVVLHKITVIVIFAVAAAVNALLARKVVTLRQHPGSR